MSAPRITRNLVVQRWGTPQATVGSVNEPREMEEHGLRFNEKWIYRLPQADPARPTERILYWLRYDLMGSVLVTGDTGTPEDVARELTGIPDRLFLPSRSEHTR